MTEQSTQLSTQKADPNPMMLIQMAMDQKADIDKLQKLMELQERWVANELEREKRDAKKAFIAAMGDFKKNPPIIVKDKQVAFLDVKYKHAELSQVSSVIGAALSEVGITHSWGVDQIGSEIIVTCTLTHELGHSEKMTMKAPPDTSGKKNSIQGIASTVSYLQRYTLLGITGMSTGEGDIDGRTPNENPTANEDAPKTQPREERAKQKPDPKNTVIQAEVDEVKLRWVNDHGTGDRETDGPAFKSWARQLIGNDFNALALSQWNRERLNKCRKYLGMKQDGETS